MLIPYHYQINKLNLSFTKKNRKLFLIGSILFVGVIALLNYLFGHLSLVLNLTLIIQIIFLGFMFNRKNEVIDYMISFSPTTHLTKKRLEIKIWEFYTDEIAHSIKTSIINLPTQIKLSNVKHLINEIYDVEYFDMNNEIFLAASYPTFDAACIEMLSLKPELKQYIVSNSESFDHEK